MALGLSARARRLGSRRIRPKQKSPPPDLAAALAKRPRQTREARVARAGHAQRRRRDRDSKRERDEREEVEALLADEAPTEPTARWAAMLLLEDEEAWRQGRTPLDLARAAARDRVDRTEAGRRRRLSAAAGMDIPLWAPGMEPVWRPPVMRGGWEARRGEG